MATKRINHLIQMCMLQDRFPECANQFGKDVEMAFPEPTVDAWVCLDKENNVVALGTGSDDVKFVDEMGPREREILSNLFPHIEPEEVLDVFLDPIEIIFSDEKERPALEAASMEIPFAWEGDARNIEECMDEGEIEIMKEKLTDNAVVAVGWKTICETDWALETEAELHTKLEDADWDIRGESCFVVM